MRIKIKQLQQKQEEWLGREIAIKGWVRTLRAQKACTFIEINDGSSLAGFQVVVDASLPNYEQLIDKIATGAALAATGKIVSAPSSAAQSIEMQATQLHIIGLCPAEQYPLQKKRHSFEFLRTIAHLRGRTNTLGAVMRVRNALAFATHCFFQERGFLYLHTPIITGSDCEGAGKMFQVTTLDPTKLPKTADGKIDYGQDFFEQPTFLTVSGQLNAEAYACALSDVYTFGPTFRAENSNTSRHLAEFWMIEPEMAFADLEDDMQCAESYLKAIFAYILKECPAEMQFFDKFISPGVIERLQKVVDTPFERTSYTFAVRVLEKAGKTFEYPPSWGCDLQTEHERFLAEEYFGKPVIITDYPKQIKAFYMRLNEDRKTVAAMDVIVPKVGEIIGGSQREERLDILKNRMAEHNLDEETYSWYLDLRLFGSVPHAGFGAGFERLVQFATGMENIRDVIPFPRYPGRADF